jgi:hypothetical protein
LVAARIHALRIRIVVDLLRCVLAARCRAGSIGGATQRSRTGTDRRTLPAANRRTETGTEQRADDCAPYLLIVAALCHASRGLGCVIAADHVIFLKDGKGFVGRGHDLHRRRYRLLRARGEQARSREGGDFGAEVLHHQYPFTERSKEVTRTCLEPRYHIGIRAVLFLEAGDYDGTTSLKRRNVSICASKFATQIFSAAIEMRQCLWRSSVSIIAGGGKCAAKMAPRSG